MPIIDTQTKIHEVLKETGLVKTDEGKTLKDILEEEDLSPRQLVRDLRSVIDHAESGSEKHTAIKTAMQLNRMLDNDNAAGGGPTVVIQINSLNGEVPTINPILIPRPINYERTT